MEIMCTYDDEDRPIIKAKFTPTGGTDFCLKIVSPDAISLQIKGWDALFNGEDFADFTALVNRINKQIGNV